MIFKLVLNLIISCQMILPARASVGEKSNNSTTEIIAKSVMKAEAEHFEKSVRSELTEMNKKTPQEYLKTFDMKWTKDEKARFLKILNSNNKSPRFKEVEPGKWEWSSQGVRISFSLKGLYQGFIKVNKSEINVNEINYSEIEELVQKSAKVSLLRKMWDATFGVENAYANPVAVLLVAIMAIAFGKIMYEYKYKPEQVLKKVQAINQDLKSQTDACYGAHTNEKLYDQTFTLASTIGGQSEINSHTTGLSALLHSIHKEVRFDSRHEMTCYEALYQVGTNLKIKIPRITQEDVNRRRDPEIIQRTGYDSNSELKELLYDTCMHYNELSRCVQDFVGLHNVERNDIISFKDKAKKDYDRYFSSGGAKRQ